MHIEFGDIVCISFVERCDGEVLTTNIEEVARDSGTYNKAHKYVPTPINVGRDIFPEGLYDELIGKEMGDVGTVILPPEKAYGKRRNERIHSMNRKDFAKTLKIGDHVAHPLYGDGFIVKMIGSKVVVDFNHKLAGKEIEYEYEIHDIITKPAEQFSCLVERLITIECETSFEDGDGIVYITILPQNIADWHKERVFLTRNLFEKHPSLNTLEFCEEYENTFSMMLDEDDDATDSEEIKVGDLVTFYFIDRFDGKVLQTNIRQVGIDNDIFDANSEYAPNSIFICLDPSLGPLCADFIGKVVGAKGTVTIPPEWAYGLWSKEEVRTIDRKEIAKDAEIGSSIHHPKYGNGIVINTSKNRVTVDFNHIFAGKDIECEYEIFERITDPAEQFHCILSYLCPAEHTASFENGTGTICLQVSLMSMDKWGEIKTKLVLELLENIASLQTLEFHEKYVPNLYEDILSLLGNAKHLEED
jgi:FKBP-type peptidyl-prolyl cis-trans isomerase 2